MIAALRGMVDNFLGRGEAAITVPPFDGALKPNQLLENAATLAELEAPEDLATDGNALFATDGARILRYDASTPTEIARFDRPATALACLPDGGLAVALDGSEVRIIGGRHDGRRWTIGGNQPFHAVNAIGVAPGGKLVVTDGSATQPYARWCHDLMELGRTGRVVELDPASGQGREMTRGLAYAFGACAPAGEIWVSESWRHRIVRLGGERSGSAVLNRLPIYPSRIAAAGGGGFWLTAFIARTMLVEFVLREPAFRKRMMREIEPQYWVAPALRSGNTYLEPMQGAHLKTMGIVKPWAPPRSYGLVIRLTPEGLPRYSLHSRVDGKNHGVVAAVECAGYLYVLAKGPRRILKLAIADAERSLQA